MRTYVDVVTKDTTYTVDFADKNEACGFVIDELIKLKVTPYDIMGMAYEFLHTGGLRIGYNVWKIVGER